MKKIIILIPVLLLIHISMLQAVPRKNFEKRFQIGIGMNMATANLYNLISGFETMNALDSAGDGAGYDDLSPEQQTYISREEFESLKNLSAAYQRAMIVSNMFAGMEYGIQIRSLWNIFMSEADIALLPMNGAYNGRLDFSISLNTGVRIPFFIMPYIMGGFNMGFQFYPDNVRKIEPWKSSLGTVGNFAFRPGFNVKAGLEIKFKKFSIGGFYQYVVKDIEEYSAWRETLQESLEQAGETGDGASAKAAGLMFSAQSKFGLSVCWYLF